MIFAGAESARFRSDLRFPVPGTAAVPVCASAAVAGCLYVHEIFSMRDAAACPTDCCPPAFCRVLPARQVTAACFLPPVRQVDATCRFAWRAALSGISGIAVPALFPAPSVVPGSFRCSRLFRVVPGPSLPGRGRPEKVTAQPLSGCAADGGYACRYSGSFPVPQRVLGSGPSHSSSRPPRANSSCGNQKLWSALPLRRARWI